MNKYSNLPKILKESNKWVCACSDSKMPLSAEMLLTASDVPDTYISRSVMCASSTDPNTWSNFETASEAYDRGMCAYLGYVFNGDGVIGIDLDHCFEDGLITEKALDIIRVFGSYTEISKSGNGIHILCRGKLPFKGSNNRDGIEIYSTARFFVLTGSRVYGEDVVENQDAIDWLLENEFCERTSVSAGNKVYQPSLYQYDISMVDNQRLKIARPTLGQGSRNCSLLSYGCMLSAKGLPMDEIEDKINKMNTERCVPPLSCGEVANVVRSVSKYRREA